MIHSWEEGTNINQCTLLTTTETNMLPARMKYFCLFQMWKNCHSQSLSDRNAERRQKQQNRRNHSQTSITRTWLQLRISSDPHLNRSPPRTQVCLPPPDSVGAQRERAADRLLYYSCSCAILIFVDPYLQLTTRQMYKVDCTHDNCVSLTVTLSQVFF